MEETKPKFSKLQPINPRCLSPFTLFQPVPTLQSENMTYIEYLMGILTQINQLITLYNQVVDELNKLDELYSRIDNLESSLELLANQTAQKLLELGNAIAAGDRNTLTQANRYTDEQIAKLPNGDGSDSGIRYGALTAEEYDSLELEAVDYDDLDLTAEEYDTRAKYILLGEDGSIFLQFKNSVTVGASDPVFTIPPRLPIKLGKRYAIEISLGTFSLNGEQNAHLEVIGMNTLGNTLPISVPSGGSATVVGVFTEAPSQVRAMSDQEQITGYNAFMKIKPLGEL